MSKKALLSLLLIGVLAFGAGLGTYAWFTSQATSTDNVFETGTLVIDNPGNGEFTSGILAVDNIYPSWTGNKTITITNSGSLDFQFRLNNITLKGSNDDAGILYNGSNGLEVSFDNATWYKANAVSNIVFGTITATEDTQNITVYYRLPSAANNDYQGKTAELEFNFLATQVGNDTWAE